MSQVSEARDVIARFLDLRLLVVGDAMLDRYVSGSVARISPEAPVPVVRVEHEEARPGGAANVALNIQDLGGQAVMSAVLGNDAAGEELLGLMSAQGIDVAGCECDDRVTTTVKTRVLAEGQQVVRVDREVRGAMAPQVLDAFRERVVSHISGLQGAIVEDYGKGAIDQALVDAMVSVAGAAHVPLGYDPKEKHHLVFPALTLATPNYMEACEAAGRPMLDLPENPAESENLNAVVNALAEEWGCQHLMITLGPSGMYLATRGQAPIHMATQAQEVYDVSGAGDTVIAATLMSLAVGAEPQLAAYIANHAAGVVVGKIGTAPCSRDELLASLEGE